jgi:hypothetical protein
VSFFFLRFLDSGCRIVVMVRCILSLFCGVMRVLFFVKYHVLYVGVCMCFVGELMTNCEYGALRVLSVIQESQWRALGGVLVGSFSCRDVKYSVQKTFVFKRWYVPYRKRKMLLSFLILSTEKKSKYRRHVFGVLSDSHSGGRSFSFGRCCLSQSSLQTKEFQIQAPSIWSALRQPRWKDIGAVLVGDCSAIGNVKYSGAQAGIRARASPLATEGWRSSC